MNRGTTPARRPDGRIVIMETSTVSPGRHLRVPACHPGCPLVRAAKTAPGGSGRPARDWIVIPARTVVLVPVAVLRYRRHTGRV
jgi:hypothetical protein